MGGKTLCEEHEMREDLTLEEYDAIEAKKVEDNNEPEEPQCPQGAEQVGGCCKPISDGSVQRLEEIKFEKCVAQEKFKKCVEHEGPVSSRVLFDYCAAQLK